jgi:nucleoside-diphosphate-sugar epimerase
MKIYIIGHKGWIGNLFMKEFEKQGHEVIYSNYRAESNEIKTDIITKQATHILYCAGRTSGGSCNTIDYLEDPTTFKENINDNLYGPLTIALFAQEKAVHFTYIGTGCIYTYDETHTPENLQGFKETDLPNFFGSNYSIVKGFTDRLLQQTNALSLRIRMPITKADHPRNFMTKLTKYTKIHSIMNSMTDLDVMIPIAINMMENMETGTYNFTNIDTTHNALLETYKKDVDENHTWELVDENGLNIQAKRSNTILDTDKLKSYLTIQHIVNSAISKTLF